jgi:sorting nexin-5/6/32
MKNELEQEYLATFKKTVAMHEVFLQRLAAHPSFRKNLNFHVFLEYEGDLSVRNKNRQEKLGTFIRNISKSADELLLSSTTKDNDEYFEKQKAFMLEYHNRLRDATARADRLSRAHKSVADSLISISAQCLRLVECIPELEGFLTRSSEYFEKSRKIENRVSSDMDLKLSDSLRYYVRDTEAAKTLLYKRFRSLADLNEANKKMERARVKGREVPQAEGAQKYAQDKFDKITGTARGELADFHARRVPYFHKNLTALADLQYKHAKTHIQLLKQTLQSLKEA